jgi:hypothetical protein
MGLFLRVLRHLLPDSIAWRLREDGDRPIERFFTGLAEGPGAARTFADQAYLDLYPETTRELDLHEREFGLPGTGTESERRAAVTAAWLATGGQSPAYIQGVLRAAGFDVYVHDWWSSGPPYVARDPRDYTDSVLVGTVQCGEPLALCGEELAQCNNFLQNDPNYLVNQTLSRRPPPPIPEDPDRWRKFMYVGGATFPGTATIPAARRAAFEDLLLQMRPLDLWIVLLIDFEGGGDPGFFFTDLSGEINPTAF